MMNNLSLKYDPGNLRYTGVIGTGGIGSGMMFRLNGDHTLGREESRSGHFLNARDYCKLHIILHYIKVLLGDGFSVIPVGKVGDDESGEQLLREMISAGFVMKYVEKAALVSTMFSICFYYPDGTGGNLTTDNSASSDVNGKDIEKAREEIIKLGSKGMIMAAPEVPLETRQKLLSLGKENGLFCAASFTSGEIRIAEEAHILSMVDLIALNLDEAATLAQLSPESSDRDNIIDCTVKILRYLNPQIQVSITAGKEGSYCWDGTNLYTFPVIKTEAKSSAGAGDAFFSGLLTGTALGIPLQGSQQLATLVAGFSITSPHTIHPELDRNTLNYYRAKSDFPFSDTIVKLLKD